MNKRILVIEDDPFAQEFYKLLLEKSGYDLTILEDGDLILKKVVAEKYDLLIIDINLKNTYLRGEKTDGMTLFLRIKELISVPTIIITAYTRYMDKQIDKIADDFILKPITDFNVLLKKIGNLIEH